MVREVTKTVYVSDDGTEWDFKFEAQEHELRVLIGELLDPEGYTEADKEVITEIMMKNFVLTERTDRER
jgi:hypothetical protein